jgi:hypothetical protein
MGLARKKLAQNFITPYFEEHEADDSTYNGSNNHSENGNILSLGITKS